MKTRDNELSESFSNNEETNIELLSFINKAYEAALMRCSAGDFELEDSASVPLPDNSLDKFDVNEDDQFTEFTNYSNELDCTNGV